VPDAPSYDHYVLVSLDTLRSDGVAANPFKLWPHDHGDQKMPRTDLLDQMVREGAFFPNTISAAPYTSASHATLFTGRWPYHHGVYEFYNRRLRGETVFTWARRQGMRTYFTSDFPIILGKELGFLDDVDDYIVEDNDLYLDRLDTSRPTLSFLHFGSLHIPYGFHNLRYGGDAYRRRVAELEKDIERSGPAVGDLLLETFRSGEDLELMLRYKQIISYHYAKEDYDTLFALYLEGIETFMRTRFEPFMERVLERFRGQRVLVVLFGDHGEEYGKNSYGHFNSVAEGVIRVPVLFWGPDVVPGTHAERVRTVDVAPTIAPCLGGVNETLDGMSLFGTVYGSERPAPRPAFCQAYVADSARFVEFQRAMFASGKQPGPLEHVCYSEAVYDGDLKLSRLNQTDAGGATGTWSPIVPTTEITLERFDADLIPHVIDSPEDATRLTAMLDEHGAHVRRDPIAPAPDDPVATAEIKEQLRDMGYDI
jgi:choline-sulfatase